MTNPHSEATSIYEAPLKEALVSRGFTFMLRLNTGVLFEHPTRGLRVIVDLGICERKDLAYIDYTSVQNEWMGRSGKTLRFAVESHEHISIVLEEIEFFGRDGEKDDSLKVVRRGREETHPDPTHPEARFEELFTLAFGETALHALRREKAVNDFDGKVRYIDYALKTRSGMIGIELNGECFHHPACVGLTRYCSQLFKQNSLVMAGWRIFRWSERGMRDTERFIEEMGRYFGPPTDFERLPSYMAARPVGTFQLFAHQEDVVNQLDVQRKAGKSTFLVELPTGLGKTEVFFEDFSQQKVKNPHLNGLILVPTTKLRDQTLARLSTRLQALRHGCEYQQPESLAGFMVQTYQHMIRHYHEYAPNDFGYVVVDEAHHAMAPGLRSVLEHFNPGSLVGVTATPDRLDLKLLAEVFGSHESNLSLRDAIEQGLLPPIRAFRIETNLDLSEIRFNGKDYSLSDLQRLLRIPARDAVVADIVVKSFGSQGLKKQGVVFCVDLRHAKVMAELLEERGIAAAAVSGAERLATSKAIESYLNGQTQFLCACSLLTEGWDAPQTSVLVMSRPTMSKVLYVQQLGRGTRCHPGKEALYVLDVVDRHGPLNAPWSVHALFQSSSYAPWGMVVGGPRQDSSPEHEILLGWLPDKERAIREIDVFTFQSKFEGYLNEEQFARELFVSTGTVRSWILKQELKADVVVPMGSRKLHYFAPERAGEIRVARGLKVHDASTQYDDLFEFLGERDYTFSYKIIFLLALLECGNERGEAGVEALADKYIGYYEDRRSQGIPVERPASPYNRPETLLDRDQMIRSILDNPFEKFERKRFMHHCKDLAYIAWTSVLWSRLRENTRPVDAIYKQLAEDLRTYFKGLGGLGDVAYLVREFPGVGKHLILAESANPAPLRVEDACVPFPGDDAFNRFLPYYMLDAVASPFAAKDQPEGSEMPIESHNKWLDVMTLGFGKRLSPDLFVCRVVGASMEGKIHNGALCVFRRSEQPREGRIFLVRLNELTDPETRASYTVKRFHSTKKQNEEGMTRETVELIPENKTFQTIRFEASDEPQLKIVAEFIAELTGLK